MSIFTVILAVVAGFLTIGAAANAGQLHASDAAGNGMAQAFAWFAAIADWLVLTVLLLVAGARGGFPRYSGMAMLVAFGLAIAGQVTALQILSASKLENLEGTLLQMVMLAAPALVITRALWGSWVPIILLVLVSLVPFAFRPRYAAQRAAAEATFVEMRQKSQDEQKGRDEQRIREMMGKIDTLPSDSALFAVIPFCADPNPSIRDEARAKARTFPRRQADAEEYLAQGHEATLRELPNFGLVATPAICASARKALAAKASLKPFDNDPIRIEDAERDVSPYIDTMRWLLANGCDCKPEIAALETAVARFAPSHRREKILSDLAAIR